jgi:hypothetical protein
MDKLELDARVARLERRVSWLTGFLILACAAASLMSLTVAGGTATLQTPATPAVMTPSPAPTMVRVSSTPHGMNQLAADLRKLRDVQLQGLISLQDLEAKKASLLAAPLEITDYASDIKAAKALQLEGVISMGDFETLKKKILEIGN